MIVAKGEYSEEQLKAAEFSLRMSGNKMVER
jgi:hypothetical protein